MKIDLEALDIEKLDNFKGGEGFFLTKRFVSNDYTVMNAVLKPDCSIGLHTHDDGCEIIRVISGCGKMVCDGEVEILEPGSVHICKQGSSHTFKNEDKCDLVFFAVVLKTANK
ncbi:MAG: cupin domain-containing protein [Clostridia bacterium]|nr:cupin domain-containing protein [Clostridia bacterium]